MQHDDSATIAAVAAAGELFRQHGGEKTARAVIGRGGDLLDFYRTLQPALGADSRGLDRSAGLSLSEGEVRAYSLSRMLCAQIGARSGFDRAPPDPFDRNSDALRAEIAADKRASSFETQLCGYRAPWSVLTRDYNASQAPVSTNLGTGYTPDALRGSLPLAALGAQVILLPANAGSFRVPVLTGDLATVEFIGEVAAATEGQPGTGMADLAPRRCAAFVEVSRLALVQGGVALDRILARVIFAKVRSLIEQASLNGTGAGANPTGIRNVSGIGAVVGGTNGLALTWAHLSDLAHAPAASSVPENAPGFLVNPGTRRYLSRTARAAGLPFMWDGGERPMHFRQAAVSTLIPSNLVKGSSGAVCSSVVYSADWSNLLIALYGAPEITVDPFTKSTEGQVRLIVDCYVGIGVLHAAAFSVMDDALTA